MSGFYSVTVASLPDYDDLVAEIYIDDTFIGLISQEEGEGRAKFEIGPFASHEVVRVDLAVFESAIAEGKKRLWDLRRSPSDK